MTKPAGSDDKKMQMLLLYDRLDTEEQRESTLPERKAQIAITLRRLEREYYGDEYHDRVDVLELRSRMRLRVAQVKASPSPWNGGSAS